MARLLMRGMTFLLVLVALAFGVSSSLMLNDPPYGDDLSGPQMTAWNGFFVLVAMLCVAAMVLGILSMSRRKIPTVLVWAFGATTLAVGVAGVVLTQEVFAGLAGD